MKHLIDLIVRNELNSLSLKEKMTGHLVKKKRRGTYQALAICTDEEQEIFNYLTTYLEDWLTQDLLNGEVNKIIKKELNIHLITELSGRGFDSVVKDILQNPHR